MFDALKTSLICLIFLLLFTPSLWAGERLLYAISYNGPAKPPIKGKQISTQLFTINPDNKKNELVFSDENASIALWVSRYYAGIGKGEFVTSKNRLYGCAIERSIDTGHDSSFRPIYHYRFGMTRSIYELFSDGTNRFRKVCDVMGTQYPRKMSMDPTGTRICYLNYSDAACKKPTLYIHEVLSGKLMAKTELAEIFLDCFATNIGWMPDGVRLFFTLDTGDVHMTSEESYQRVGTYLMKEDGMEVTRLPEAWFSFPSRHGFSGGLTPQCLGATLDGSLIIRDVRHKRGDGRGVCSFVYLVNPETGSREEIPMELVEGLKCFKVSHGGTKMAFIENAHEDDTIHIRVKDLNSGKEDKVFSFPAGTKEYYLSLVGWIGD
jgi:hypothetical protein